MAKKRAVDCVLAANVEFRKPNKTWTKHLPECGRKEMEEVRQEWIEGRLKGVSMSIVYRGIVNRCKEESWPAPKSETTINRWLRSENS